MGNLYQLIDMDNGLCAYDRRTLEEAIELLHGDENLAMMPMAHMDDNYAVKCSFCGRHGFEPVYDGEE